MHITLFGASGHVGTLTVAEALKRGHTVTVFVHSRNPFDGNVAVRAVQGDIHDMNSVAEAITGSEAVISCLGSWHTKTKDILTAAMHAVIPVMQQQGVQRIVTLTGAAAFDIYDELPLGQKLAHKLFLLGARKIVEDGEVHIKLLRASNLDWTVLRAPVMNDRGTDTYRLSSKLPGLFDTINRTAVAKALIDQLENTEQRNQAPIIYRA